MRKLSAPRPETLQNTPILRHGHANPPAPARQPSGPRQPSARHTETLRDRPRDYRCGHPTRSGIVLATSPARPGADPGIDRQLRGRWRRAELRWTSSFTGDPYGPPTSLWRLTVTVVS